MTTVVIMQPTYLPWIGYFDLMDQADIFVFLDDAQFSRQSWHHRNRIRTPTGLQWLTVPVHRQSLSARINEVTVATETGFAAKHLRSIELNYRRAAHFARYFEGLRDILLSVAPNLAAFNMRLIQWLAQQFHYAPRFHASSALDGHGERSALMVDICRKLGADTCLSPMGAATYLATELDPGQQILDLRFHDYEHPVYRQLHRPFLPFASAIDLLFNEGVRSAEVLRSGRRGSRSALDVFATIPFGA